MLPPRIDLEAVNQIIGKYSDPLATREQRGLPFAARRAGATWQEMQDTINLCFLFRGLSAANRGAEILGNIAQREQQAAAQEVVNS